MTIAPLTHPTPQQLAQFNSGKLNAAESNEVEQHIDQCESCCQLLKSLPDDTLVSLLRAESDTAVEDKEKRESQFAATILPESAHATIPPSANQTVAPEANDAALGEVPAGLRAHPRYRVISLLGRGGMGSVYQAEHRLMKRSVALKVINPQLVQNSAAVERFHREVQAAAKLAHPNIVAAYDAEQAADAHFLVMEFVPGEDLAALVQQHGRLPIQTACDYVRQAALGLAHAHERGMVHRDIKPQNLMLTNGGQVKILDFGLAQFASEIAEVSGLTQLGAIMGTPDYMAPEQARDAHSADIRADIYSLGCTLYNLLTGSTPYTDNSALGKIMAHAEREPTPLAQLNPTVPASLVDIVQKMIAKKPAERFQTPAEVAEALASFAQNAPTKGATLASGANPPRSPVSMVTIAFATAAILAALGVIVIATDKGQIEIQSEVDDVEVVVKQGGKEIEVIDTKTGSRVKWLPSGKYDIELKEDRNDLEINRDGFKLTRWGKEVVTLKRKAAAPGAPEKVAANQFVRDQKAVEWIVRIGATARVNIEGVERHVAKPEEIPNGDWQVTEISVWPVHLGPNVKLDKLAGLKSLRWLRLFGTQISDEGLCHLTDVPRLSYLDLDMNNSTTDASLKHIGQHLTSLESLGLDHTSITDDGLAHLGPVKNLGWLNLTATRLTGSGLSHLKPLASLKFLSLNLTSVTDASLAHLTQLPALENLELRQTQVTDEAIVHLARLDRLKKLDLREARVSLAGLQKLEEALPNTLIVAFTAEQQKEQWSRTVESVAWTPLEPTNLTASGGTTLRRLDDQSLLAEGQNPVQSIYTVVAKSSLKRVSALRLDVIRDDRLPSQGPGRAHNGTFVLTGIEVRFVPDPGAAAQDVAVRRSFADYCQGGYDVSLIATPGKGTWGIFRADGPPQSHSLVLDLAAPLTLREDATISVTLHHESEWPNHNLGRFRLSATDVDRAPADKSTAPDNVPASRVGINLISDPSFEDTAATQLPRGWSAWLTDGLKFRCEVVEGGRTDKKCLRISGEGTRGVAFANSIPLDRSKRYALKGWAKFEGDKDARAIIKFNYFHAGKWLGVHDLAGVTADQPGWQLLEKTDVADSYPEATLLVPTCHVEGSGTGWFDDLELIAYDRDKLPANFDKLHGKHNRLFASLDFDRWIGEWDTTIEAKPTAEVPRELSTPALLTTRKVLADRFLMTHSTSEADPTQFLWFLTLDPNLAAYRLWLFGSSGEAFERRGQWDAASQSLTLQLQPPSPGVTGKSVDRFLGNDRIESTLLVKAADGQVTRDVRWTARKKTPQPENLSDIPTVAAPAPLPEELSLLNKFAGEWTISAKRKPSVWLPKGGEGIQSEKVAWILGGRFLMARTFDEKEQLSSIWLATYEPSEKANRFWLFNADGSSGQWRVTWDASSHGFHWRSIDMPTGWIGTGFNRWIDDDSFDNQALIKDENGRVLLDGTQDKRRKK